MPEGPDVTWYLAIAGTLFATGALGVLIRRSPLIVLLSLEIMLNGANLALIAFARQLGDGDGQIFALAVMAVAASEVVVGLGLIVAMARRRARPRRRHASRSCAGEMTVGAWICLLSPLAGALLITLLGTRISRRAAGLSSRRRSSFVAFGGALVAFFASLGDDPEARQDVTVAWTWLAAGNVDVGLSILVDPLSMMMMLVVTGVGSLIVAYSIGYMDGDDEERRYFAYMSLFVFSMLLLVLAANYCSCSPAGASSASPRTC